MANPISSLIQKLKCMTEFHKFYIPPHPPPPKYFLDIPCECVCGKRKIIYCSMNSHWADRHPEPEWYVNE
jgi:hypothetical protein